MLPFFSFTVVTATNSVIEKKKQTVFRVAEYDEYIMLTLTFDLHHNCSQSKLSKQFMKFCSNLQNNKSSIHNGVSYFVSCSSAIQCKSKLGKWRLYMCMKKKKKKRSNDAGDIFASVNCVTLECKKKTTKKTVVVAKKCDQLSTKSSSNEPCKLPMK